MSLSSLRSVGDAIDTTRSFLIPPSIGRWSKLALIVLFFGTAGTPVPASPQLLDPRFWRGFEEDPAVDADNETAFEPTDGPGDDGANATAPEEGGLPEGVELPPPDAIDISAVLPYVAALLGVLALVAVAYVLLGILMRFVIVESLRSENVLLGRYSRANLRGAVGVFGFRVFLGVLAVPALLVAFVSVSPFGPFQLSLAGGAIVAILAVTWLTLLFIADWITQQFVVPVMIECECGVLGGWQRLRPTFLAEWKEYVAFGFVRLALDIAVGIASAILLLVAGVILGIVFATIGGVVVLVGGMPTLGSATLAALSVLVLLFVLSLIVAFAYVNVPFQVYLWYYALLVLGDIDEEFDLIPEQRLAARSEANSIVGR